MIFKLLYLIWLSLCVNSSYCFMLNVRSCRLTWIGWARHVSASLPLYWGQWHIFQEGPDSVIHLFSFPVSFVILSRYVLSFVAQYFCPFGWHSPLRLSSADAMAGVLMFSETFHLLSSCLPWLPDFLGKIFSCSHGSFKNLLNPLLGLQIGFAQVELSTSLVGNVPCWVDAQHNSPALVVQVLTFIPPSAPVSNILVFVSTFGLGITQLFCFFMQFLIWSHLPTFSALDKPLWLFKSSPSALLCLSISA